MIVHLTARARFLPVELTTFEVATWFWARMRRAFPSALAAVLMPNHPHLLTGSDDLRASGCTFQRLLAGLRRSSNPGSAIEWEPVGSPEVVEGPQKNRRMVRYFALNPCRAKLADDPLSWPWSTHRDVMGATADPWVDRRELRRVCGWRASPFANELQRYVSSDPSVCVVGTPPPVPAEPTVIAQQPLVALVDAAAAATRGKPGDIRRQSNTRTLFLRLAMRHGWDDTARLATLCEVDPRTVQRHRTGELPAGLAAAELCLGDQRLRRWNVGR